MILNLTYADIGIWKKNCRRNLIIICFSSYDKKLRCSINNIKSKHINYIWQMFMLEVSSSFPISRVSYFWYMKCIIRQTRTTNTMTITFMTPYIHGKVMILIASFASNETKMIVKQRATFCAETSMATVRQVVWFKHVTNEPT